MKQPFWEETYKENEGFTFGAAPNKSLVEVLDLLKDTDHIIDVGCGDGQNAIYLAKKGFKNVEAFDLSENGIAKLKRIAKKEGCELKAWAQDICDFSFSQYYKLIMSFGTLHFVSKADWHRFILEAKKYTEIGGLNIIQIFTDQVPASSDIAPYAIGLASDGEIKELYADWEILFFNSYVFEDEHPNVPKHLHASNKIVARRIR